MTNGATLGGIEPVLGRWRMLVSEAHDVFLTLTSIAFLSAVQRLFLAAGVVGLNVICCGSAKCDPHEGRAAITDQHFFRLREGIRCGVRYSVQPGLHYPRPNGNRTVNVVPMPSWD